MSFKIKLADFVTVTGEGQIDLNPHIRAVSSAKGLPIKVAYDLSKIAEKLSGELKFFADKRLELFKEFGEDTGNDSWRLLPEKLDEFNVKHLELVNLEVEVAVNPIPIAAFGDKVDSVTADDLLGCRAFIVE